MNRQPLSAKHRMRIGATMLGITLAEYEAHYEAGEKWCPGHQTWHLRNANTFYSRPSTPDGLDTLCKEIVRERSRECMQRLYARRRAQGIAS